MGINSTDCVEKGGREGRDREISYILVFIKLFIMFLDFILIQQQCERGFGFIFIFKISVDRLDQKIPRVFQKKFLCKFYTIQFTLQFFLPDSLIYIGWLLRLLHNGFHTKSWGKQSSLVNQINVVDEKHLVRLKHLLKLERYIED